MSTFLTKNNIVFLCLIYLIVLCSFNLLKEFDYINEYILIGMFFFTFLYFLIISYYKLNLGVHPLFIFIAMLLIFQGGLFISYLFTHDFDDIMYSQLQGANVYLSFESVFKSLNLIFISIFVTFSTVVFSKNKQNFNNLRHKDSKGIDKFFLILFLLLLPFDIYKKIFYLNYIIEHGGYIAIYANNGEHIEAVGTLVRILSLISTLCFYIFFISCGNKKKVLMITLLIFFPLSLFDLALGLRGKFFTFWIVFILFYKIKFGGHFSIRNLILSTVLVSVTSVLIAFIREEKDITFDNPIGLFFKSQGVSFHVTALSIELENYLDRFGLNYLFNPIISGFSHQTSFGQGKLLANDLSNLLNAQAFDSGYATGSVYIPELYLSGGYIGVILGSFIIGKVLNNIRLTAHHVTNVLIFILTINIVYLPRASFFSPIAELLKALPFILTLYILWIFFKKVFKSI